MVVNRRKATALGSIAIVMWSSVALLTTLTGDVPPLQLTAMTFSIAFLIGTVFWFKNGIKPSSLLELPSRVWLIGVGGLFGYHFFYFLALKSAPVVEANLINYLWPLLIILLSSLLPGERLRWYHIAGGAIGFVGAVLLITGGHGIAADSRYTLGYLAALVCAFAWAAYSVLSRRYGSVPTNAVGAFCGVTAILGWLFHLLFEKTVWPAGPQWFAVVVMGIGPMGLAFFAWDFGVKRGNIKSLGALSYFAPLLSTLLLIAAGRAGLSWQIAAACILIIGGAVLASGVVLRQRPPTD